MRVFLFFAHRYPWRTLVMVLCLLLAALSEAAGLSTLLPVLGIAMQGEGGEAVAPPANPSALEETARSALAGLGITPSLGQLIPIVVAAFLVKAVLVLLANRQVGYTVAHIAAHLRLDLLRALLSTRWSYYTRQPIGAVANAMTSEAERASRSYHFLSQLLSQTVQTLLYTSVALAVSWQATIGAAAAGVSTVLALNALVRAASRAGQRQTRLFKSLLSRLTDTLQAVKLLKATGREGLIGPLLETDTRLLKRAQRKVVFSKEALAALQEPILVAFLLGGLFLIHTFWRMPAQSLAMLVIAFARAMMSLNKVQRRYQIAMTESSAVWSLVGMIEQARAEREPTGGEQQPSLDRGICLEGVRVEYDGRAVLDDLSLEIPAGGITALVGVSGAGKSTIADLITGLRQPESGEIRVDGVLLQEIDLQRWRRDIGYVPQDLPMLHESVRINVTLGAPGVTDAEVETALREASAWEFVTALPEGLENPIGERGSLLSGGQRQRVAIARALLHRPKLLILDEATASLDAENAASVWSAVEKLRGSTTILAISHQAGAVATADRIYHIEDAVAVPVATPPGSPSPSSGGQPAPAGTAAGGGG